MAGPGRGAAAGDRPAVRNRSRRTATGRSLPYARDERLARPWAVPGTPGLQHRIGGLEKSDVTGNISYDGRQPRADDRAAGGEGGRDRRRGAAAGRRLEPDPARPTELLVLGWGSTEGAIRAGVRIAREAGHRVACAQLRHLNPLPANTGDVLRSFERVLVPELNSGQLASLLRARFLVDVESYAKVRGQPLYAAEIAEQIAERQ